MRRAVSIAALAGTALLITGCGASLSSPPAPPLDRTVMPAPGPRPSVDFPSIERFTLSNGLPVSVVERPGVPLVSVQMLFEAGAVADPDGKLGLASLTADMLTEGTTTRTATELAEEIDFLAADLNAGIGRETAVVNLSTLVRNLDQSLEIFADVVTNPAFRTDDWQRIQQQRLVSLLQALDRPATIAGQEFARIVYGEAHAYGRPTEGTPETVNGITPDDLRSYHSRFYVPGNANLIVVGDVDADALRSQLESAFGNWRAGSPPPLPPLLGPATPEETIIYLVDKPGAAQSVIRVGHQGVDRASRDYFPLLVLNALLGGDFTSRLNMNLREDKGYTYGAFSNFAMARFAGPFMAGADVQTAVTAQSVAEFVRELEEIRGARPIDEEELVSTRTAIVRQEPLRLETNSQIAGRVADLIRYDLPADYFDSYTDQIAAVSLQDINRVAREYLHPANMAIVVVGDQATIEPALRDLGYPVEIVTVAPPEVPGR